MKNTIAFEVITDIFSEELYQYRYIVGKVTENCFIYIWSQNGSEEIDITSKMLNQPKCELGAMIGTAKEIADHIEICVGLHRDDCDPVTAEAATEVVNGLIEALSGESAQ